MHERMLWSGPGKFDRGAAVRAWSGQAGGSQSGSHESACPAPMRTSATITSHSQERTLPQ